MLHPQTGVFFNIHDNGNQLIHSTMNPYANDDRHVYFISDVQHLLTTARNCFANSYKVQLKIQTSQILYKGKKTQGKRGPLKSFINESIQVGINQWPIGPTSVRRVLASATIKPPLRTVLQNNANIVNYKIKQINTINDMKDIRSKLKVYY